MAHNYTLYATGSVETPDLHAMILAHNAEQAKVQGASLVRALHGKYINFWLYDANKEMLHRYRITVPMFMVE